ncbi:hypothetical protein [Actinomadura sp. CNU-125]|uniref:hypothetical protein n=1 Tax=Actinomadura sp. CNU-125 TaxID=1904961 RepID=UPI000A9FEC0D|nr:hypothetical protein [Actinomadura sp. CNU-125]
MNEVDERDKVDELMVQLARGRVALGVAAFAAPGLTVRAMGMGRGADAGRDFVTRMFAAREIALGAGYLLSGAEGRKLWARLGLGVDSLDTVTGLRGRKGVPLWAAVGALSVSGSAAALGAAKVAKDVLR